jgi:hypothetical protein
MHLTVSRRRCAARAPCCFPGHNAIRHPPLQATLLLRFHPPTAKEEARRFLTLVASDDSQQGVTLAAVKGAVAAVLEAQQFPVRACFHVPVVPFGSWYAAAKVCCQYMFSVCALFSADIR